MFTGRVNGVRGCVLAVSSISAVIALVGSNRSVAQPPQPAADVVCETLMADYILSRGKIETANIDAAVQLIASRSRTGYWRTVFQHYQEDSDNRRLLEILTKMLERDGQARWLLSHPDELRHSAWIPQLVLSDEVLEFVMARAREVDRRQLDALVVAVVAAHDARSRDFLLDVISGEVGAAPDRPSPAGAVAPNRRLDDEASFYAAVGLANLGDVVGFQWLLDDHLGDRPDLEARLQALSELTREQNRSLEEWRVWWRENSRGDRFEPKSWVRLRLRS